MLTRFFHSFNLKNKLTNFFISGILAAFGVFSGTIPQLSTGGNLNWDTAALAQSYSAQDVQNYARAGYYIELLRQQAYREIMQITNTSPPNIACNQRQTIEQLSPQVKKIALDYCQESQSIVTRHNLSIERFNQLKNLYDNGGDFYREVQNAIIRIQKQEQ